MENNDERLTSAEVANLWRLYIAESLTAQFKRAFVETCEDQDIRSAVQFSKKISDNYIQDIERLFREENYPIPIAFSEKDINLNAPALFSDAFCLHHTHQATQLGMGKIHEMMGTTVRQNVWDILNKGVNDFKDLYRQTLDLLLAKGLYSRPASVPPEEKTEFAEGKQYVAGWLGSKRSLNTLEIMNIHAAMIQNSISKTLLRGFQQTAKDEDIRDYFAKGVKNASDIMKDLGETFIKENTNITATLDSELLPTTTAPFSDKLMMSLVTHAGSGAIGIYGNSIGTMFRRDLGVKFIHFMKDGLQYAHEGMQLLIDKGWMEEPPQAPDHDQLKT